MNATSTEYHQLNAGAHRKSNMTVQAPALTCHLGFWTPCDLSADGHDRWRDTIDRSIVESIRRLRAATAVDSVSINGEKSGTVLLLKTAVDFQDLGATPVWSLTLKMQYVLNSDYRNVYITALFGDHQISFSYELHTEYLSLNMILQNNPNAPPQSKRDDLFSSLPAAFEDLSRHLKGKIQSGPPSQILYQSFWDTIIDRFIPADTPDDAESIGSIFADFRGIIISDETRTFRDQHFANDHLRSGPQWGDASVTDLQGVIGDLKHEITASYMLSGRALYLTNLGPQLPQASLRERIPTRYIVYVHQRDLSIQSISIVNKWQLGRLVDRLHWLGAHRLAALKNLSELRAASQVLAGLDHVAKRVGETGSDREVYNAMQKHIRNISDGILGGLQYRTERSRYYVSNFRRMVANLRIVRVEGYQPYDVFIEQRLGSIFNFIDRLGIRYERALASITRTRENATSDELVLIQKFGEGILLAVLAPYYISHLFEMAGLYFGFEQFGSFLVWVIMILICVFREQLSRKVRMTSILAFCFSLFISLVALFITLCLLSWKTHGEVDVLTPDHYVKMWREQASIDERGHL